MKVLVIDDDLISRMALIDVLRSMPKLAVMEAESGETAWALLARGLHPALCCCDVRMPGMSGIELLQRMRAHARMAKIPVLLVTSASDRDTVTAALKLGASGFIVKPFQAADVRGKIEAVLGANMENLFEDAAAASKRLGVPPARYAAYLAALAGQIDSAVLKAQSGAALDKQALDALQTGCLTLGAAYCATVVDAAAQSVADGSLLAEELIDGVGTLSAILRDRSTAVREKWR